MRACLLSLLGCVLLGCATTPTPPQLSITPPLAGHPEPIAVVADAESVAPDLPVLPVTPMQAVNAIAEANREALVRPSRAHFRGAQVVYPVCEACIYAVELAYQTPTHLVWPPGEMFIRSAQDEWFQVEQKVLGEPPQDHVLVVSKLSRAAFPEIAKRSFRMTVLTTKAVYHLQLRTQDDPGRSMTSITWQHPAPPKPLHAWLPGAYYTGYDVLGDPSRPPLWTPLGVWDTGTRGQTLIRFPAAVGTATAPVLYVLGPDGAKHLTTVTPRGSWYVVDQLFEAAELRVGHEDPSAQVVTLRRGASYRVVSCPGADACPPETGL